MLVNMNQLFHLVTGSFNPWGVVAKLAMCLVPGARLCPVVSDRPLRDLKWPSSWDESRGVPQVGASHRGRTRTVWERSRAASALHSPQRVVWRHTRAPVGVRCGAQLIDSLLLRIDHPEPIRPARMIGVVQSQLPAQRFRSVFPAKLQMKEYGIPMADMVLNSA